MVQVFGRSARRHREVIDLGGRIHLVVFTFRGDVVGGSLVADGASEPEVGGVSAARWFNLDEAKGFKNLARVLHSTEGP